MHRDVSIEEISDGRLYTANDMARVGCYGCEGCCDCCKGMGDSIVLDPLDVHRLRVNLGKSPEQLLQREISLGIMDGNILPFLQMSGTDESCIFLSKEGRCTVHGFRPGICRLFPLGRYYENHSFRYFIQVHECKKKNREKMKIKKWIDVPDVKQYEKFVNDWHYFLKDVQAVLLRSEEDTELIKNLNMYVIRKFYFVPYDPEKDFYSQFYERLSEGQALLQLE